MVNKLKEYWFGILMFSIVIVCIVFTIIVALSPHSDSKMRGFSPCTLEFASKLSTESAKNKLWGVFGAVVDVNLCYAGIMRQGMELWIEGKQDRPWSNYIFEKEKEIDNFYEDVEPFSKELIEANLLNEEDSFLNIKPIVVGEPVVENENEKK